MSWADPSGLFGGIYADSGWNAARDWAPYRKEKIRALQRASTPGLGVIGPVEELFHRVFGERGTTEYEFETLGLRRELVDLADRVQVAIPSLGPAKALEANAALVPARRLVNTYPETAYELESWVTQTNASIKTLKTYLPFNWTPWIIGAGVLGFVMLFVASKGWLKGSPRSNPRRRRKTRRNPRRWSGTKVQSLLIPTSKYTKAQAKTWAKSHGYRYGKVDTTAKYHRLRQVAPKKGRAKRTVTFGRGIKAVVEQVR